jgi:putative transposase
MPSRLRRHDEFGHVHFVTASCYRRLQFFRHPGARDAFVETMKVVRDKLRIRWLGYVVMPEHVHFLVLPQAVGAPDVVPISLVLHDLKGLSGKDCKQALRECWRRHGSLGTAVLDAWATAGATPASAAAGRAPRKRFWKERGYDFNIIEEDKIVEKLDYMHANPVRRGLVERPEQWRWSSYRYYELGDDSMISMDWDGSLPIEL